MQAQSLEIPETIGRRFHRPPVPSVVAHSASRHPVVFSHVASQTAMPGPTLTPPVESAFALHVHHQSFQTGDIWIDGKHSSLAPVGRSGILIFDLRSEPVAQLHEGFEFSRFHFSRAAIDDLAYEQGMRALGDLYVEHGHADPVVYHLALAMLGRVEVFGRERDTLFQDSIALALLAHVAQQYGGASEGRIEVGVLAPWQYRRVCEWVDSHLHASISIADIAALVNLSPSYFSRAFRRSTGLPPHRWLLHRRIDLAKQLLKATSSPLIDISASCGFVDQSHFTKVFTRAERVTPAQWRRLAQRA